LYKFENNEIVKEKLRKFKIISETSDLTGKIIDKGLSSKFSDFEDALQYHCALITNCNLLITRNVKDFKKSAIPVMTPDEYLKSLRDK
ncbi:MAG: PIN domain nuclease, partial [Draconibacterium sp.]|nr:PIN domain nuclease [Draconibacterium sp.]